MRKLSLMSLVPVLLVLFSSSSGQTCVLPTGTNHDRDIEVTGIVRAWANCYLTIEVGGVQRALFAGRLNVGNDVTPSIGQTIRVRYDPVTSHLSYATFPIHPFVVPVPPAPSFTSIFGWSRPGARMKINVNWSPTQVAIADSIGHYRFDNVQVGKFITVQPEMASVLFEPSIWSGNLQAQNSALVNFSSHTFPYPLPHTNIKRIVIPQTLITVKLGEVVALNTQAFDAQNNQIVPTPTLMYLRDIVEPSKVFVNWDSHLIIGAASGTTTLRAQTCAGFSAADPCPTPAVLSNTITVAVVDVGPTPTPTATYEFSRFDILGLTINQQDDLLASAGEQGYGSCWVFVQTRYFYCLRPKIWAVKYDWARWPFPNGQPLRDAQATEVGQQGYSNVMVLGGQLRASRPKSP